MKNMRAAQLNQMSKLMANFSLHASLTSFLLVLTIHPTTNGGTHQVTNQTKNIHLFLLPDIFCLSTTSIFAFGDFARFSSEKGLWLFFLPSSEVFSLYGITVGSRLNFESWYSPCIREWVGDSGPICAERAGDDRKADDRSPGWDEAIMKSSPSGTTDD